MEHKEQFVIGSDESHEEVGNKQHVEYEVELKNYHRSVSLLPSVERRYLERDGEGEETFLQEPQLGVIEVGELRADADDEHNSVEDFPRLPSSDSQPGPGQISLSPWSGRSVTPQPTPWLHSKIQRAVVGHPLLMLWYDIANVHSTLFFTNIQDSILKTRTENTPVKNVKREDRRKHQYFL